MGQKDYKMWMPVKAAINNRAVRPEFKERDVFWASIGENVGYEQDGKNRHFDRPVVVVKKFNNSLFWGVPLSTTERRGKYYFEVGLQDKKGRRSVAILSQMRLYDSSRLEEKIGMVSTVEHDGLKKQIAKLLLG